MLEIIPYEPDEMFDEETNKFVKVRSKERVFHFEHSLAAISVWEAKYRKPFLSNKAITPEQLIDYICMMNLDDDFNPNMLAPENITEITEYMADTNPTATVISSSDDNNRNSRTIMTSEVIYAWMANAGIPFECDKWNVNRLLMLVSVISEFNKPRKQMSEAEILRRQHEINQKRLAAMKNQNEEGE